MAKTNFVLLCNLHEASGFDYCEITVLKVNIAEFVD